MLPSLWDERPQDLGPERTDPGQRDVGNARADPGVFLGQVTQLTQMLDVLLEGEIEDPDLLECHFLEALYCSLGAALLDHGRIKFDECVKRLASLPTAETEGVWASPGELPGRNQVSWVFLGDFWLGFRGSDLALAYVGLCGFCSGFASVKKRAMLRALVPSGEVLVH